MAAYTRRSCIYCMLTAAARATTPRIDTKNQPRPRAERLTSCEHARRHTTVHFLRCWDSPRPHSKTLASIPYTSSAPHILHERTSRLPSKANGGASTHDQSIIPLARHSSSSCDRSAGRGGRATCSLMLPQHISMPLGSASYRVVQQPASRTCPFDSPSHASKTPHIPSNAARSPPCCQSAVVA
jgi:hypothetical protein